MGSRFSSRAACSAGVLLVWHLALPQAFAADPAVLQGHSPDVWVLDVALAPDGTKAASVNQKGQVLLWDLKTGRSTQLIQQGEARYVAFTADGATVLAGNIARVLAFDAASGAGRATFGPKDESDYRAWIAPDGSRVAVREYAGDGITCTVHDVAKRKPLVEFVTNRGAPLACALPAAAGRVAAVPGAGRGEVRLFDLVAGKELTPLRGMQSDIKELAIDPPGKRLAVLDGNDLVLWDLTAAAPKLAGRTRGPDASLSMPLSFTSDGSALLFATSQSVSLFDLAARKPRPAINGASGLAAVSPDGKLVLAAASDGRTAVADAATSQVKAFVEVNVPAGKHAYEVGPTAYEIASDSSFVAIGTRAGTVEIRPLAADVSADPIASFEIPRSPTAGSGSWGSVLFSPDGTRLLLNKRDWAVLIDPKTGKATSATEQGDSVPLSDAFFKPNEQALIALSGEGSWLYKIDTTSGRAARNPRDTRQYFAVAASPDGSKLAGELREKEGGPVRLVLMNPADGSVIGQPLADDLTADHARLVFSSNGATLAAVFRGGELKVFNAADGTEIPVSRPRVEPSESVGFVAAEPTLAVVNLRDEITFYDLDTGQEKETKLALARLHTNGVEGCVLSPTAPQFASFGQQGDVVIGDLRTGELIARLNGLTKRVAHAAFSPDGKTLAAAEPLVDPIGGGESGTLVKLWTVPGVEIRPRRNTPAPSLTPEPPPPGPFAPREIASFDVPQLQGSGDLICRLLFSPDGKKLIAARMFNGDMSSASLFALCDPIGGKVLKVFENATGSGGYTTPPYVWSADSKAVASNSGTRSLYFADLEALTEAQTDGKWNCQCVAFPHDGKSIAMGTQTLEDGIGPTLFLLDRATLNPLGPELKLRDGWVSALACSPDGKSLAASWTERRKSKLAFLNPATLAIESVLFEAAEENPASWYVIDFSPDGSALWGLRNGNVAVWRPAEGPKPVFEGPASEPIFFVGDTGLLASSGGTTLTELATGQVRATIDPTEALGAHPGNMWCVAHSADGKRFAVGGPNGKVAVWDLATGQAFDPFQAHDGKIGGVGLSPNGNLLATIDEDAVVKIWTLAAAAEGPPRARKQESPVADPAPDPKPNRPAPSTPTTPPPAKKLKRGDKVEVEYQGKWYKAEVIGVAGGRYRIHYDGYPDSNDEWVAPARIKP